MVARLCRACCAVVAPLEPFDCTFYGLAHNGERMKGKLRIDARTGLVSALDVIRLCRPELNQSAPCKCLDNLRLSSAHIRCAIVTCKIDNKGNSTPLVPAVIAADVIMRVPRMSAEEQERAFVALCGAYGVPEAEATDMIAVYWSKRNAGADGVDAFAVEALRPRAPLSNLGATPMPLCRRTVSQRRPVAAEEDPAVIQRIVDAVADRVAEHIKGLATETHFAEMSALEEQRRADRAAAAISRKVLEEQLRGAKRPKTDTASEPTEETPFADAIAKAAADMLGASGPVTTASPSGVSGA
ncbi:hypothetical protein JKP88DRAFT_273107 [Tribonema minus]|uniref:Uncharacterized protein n=1 Tax=Tribonema minus TaxID=303371 RepID=A0A836CEX7_9STRA|nr:hypothetical protein JKP88DRAFT_273107 [Tribonema minus]